MFTAQLPELRLDLVCGSRDEQIPQRSHRGIVGGLIVGIDRLTCGRWNFLRRHAARSRDNVENLLAGDPARVALIAVSVRREEEVGNYTCFLTELIDAAAHLKAAAVAALAIRRVIRCDDQSLFGLPFVHSTEGRAKPLQL